MHWRGTSVIAMPLENLGLLGQIFGARSDSSGCVLTLPADACRRCAVPLASNAGHYGQSSEGASSRASALLAAECHKKPCMALYCSGAFASCTCSNSGTRLLHSSMRAVFVQRCPLNETNPSFRGCTSRLSLPLLHTQHCCADVGKGGESLRRHGKRRSCRRKNWLAFRKCGQNGRCSGFASKSFAGLLPASVHIVGKPRQLFCFSGLQNCLVCGPRMPMNCISALPLSRNSDGNEPLHHCSSCCKAGCSTTCREKGC
mmetsp:Transcript_102405/g.203302  ORF Transcript_102405/g.203302 Transcript_102405/m.203302 type:complete len:258 (-) Transcript_102405:958-1731(-)